ncbi:hypothetical protein JAAARDRAFT_715565 [Jaapia argillacea MUCL 33604]|uniref:Ubiquitin carboxyl-terminal hydrolase n=1 Tax=Jaapia argillacea MUCL 33604 TaxID=933084 RepID=A0A067PZ24_9AGAM|nr:hypothetical protein JAAARDRAFT_715565 [Jaapia argillacea MUCL 33604]
MSASPVSPAIAQHNAPAARSSSHSLSPSLEAVKTERPASHTDSNVERDPSRYPSAKRSLLEKSKIVAGWNARRPHGVLHIAKRRKIAHPACDTCGVTLTRPFACLRCSSTGCWFGGHISQHLHESGHQFCMDVKSGSVFCSSCDDFVYEPLLEHTFSSTTLAAEEKATKFQSREPFQAWVPSDKDKAALQEMSGLPCQGRRGLLNLGQTCFLNVILQSFIHNPLLRNFFLSDKHNSKLCKTKDCTCCEMDTLFSEVFSEDTNPYGPISFLATTWRASSELSGYAQQDAHEFFISALNQIHTTSRGSTNVSCICIIHSTFAGQLQSDVKCERCGNVTSTIDPMLDISLELKTKSGEVATGENTLATCLKKFTQPEKLGSKEYSCAKCGKASHDASKRLSIKKLPPVLSFQFKRFEHKSSAQKIDTFVRFPATLNMAPYTTLVMSMKDKENGYTGPEALYEYDLFAVICHEGQIDNGHYTNYARCQDEWYRFDDDKVTHSNLGAVLGSTAYMCFYVKRHLDYKPYVIPSYILTRETELEKEKEREREKEAALAARKKEVEKEVEDELLATV